MPHSDLYFVNTLIVIGYIIIATQFAVLLRHKMQNSAARSCASMVGIFTLCALSGYVPGLFYWWPMWLSDLTHIILLFCTYAYIFSQQAQHITNNIALVERKVDSNGN